MYEFQKGMLVYLEDRTGRIHYEGNIIVVDGPIKDFPIGVDFPDRFRNQINRFRFDFSGIPHECLHYHISNHAVCKAFEVYAPCFRICLHLVLYFKTKEKS